MRKRNVYDYAAIRIVPDLERQECLNAGAILFCKGSRYLRARVLQKPGLRAILPQNMDCDEALQQLQIIELIARGGPACGYFGDLSQTDRFNWLVAPSSTVIQPGAVHSGYTSDPDAALEELFSRLVSRG